MLLHASDLSCEHTTHIHPSTQLWTPVLFLGGDYVEVLEDTYFLFCGLNTYVMQKYAAHPFWERTRCWRPRRLTPQRCPSEPTSPSCSQPVTGHRRWGVIHACTLLQGVGLPFSLAQPLLKLHQGLRLFWALTGFSVCPQIRMLKSWPLYPRMWLYLETRPFKRWLS